MQDKQELAAYIIKDAVDDFGDVIHGVRELNKIFDDPKLARMVGELQNMQIYVERKRVDLDKIKNVNEYLDNPLNRMYRGLPPGRKF